jgi:hypothetical protein
MDPGYDEVTVYLARNPNNLPPTPQDVMESWTITQFQSWSAWSQPHHLSGNGTSFLEKGSSYWLWAVGGDTTWCGWCMNEDPALTCPHTLRREGENWLPIANETAGAFRVDGVLDFGLAADTYTLSEGTGGVVGFKLAAGASNGGRNYLLFGSMSGTSPGTPLPGGHVTLPLNWDLFTNMVIGLVNTPFFKEFMGTLDGDGAAEAEFNSFGPLPGGSAGLSLCFAYALNNKWDYASNPVIVEIVP